MEDEISPIVVLNDFFTMKIWICLVKQTNLFIIWTVYTKNKIGIDNLQALNHRYYLPWTSKIENSRARLWGESISYICCKTIKYSTNDLILHKWHIYINIYNWFVIKTLRKHLLMMYLLMISKIHSKMTKKCILSQKLLLC